MSHGYQIKPTDVGASLNVCSNEVFPTWCYSVAFCKVFQVATSFHSVASHTVHGISLCTCATPVFIENKMQIILTAIHA